jgi:transposase
VIQVTPQMRILVAIEPVDFRAGIDGIARICRERMRADPFSGTAYVFRNRRATAIKVLAYDGQGFWLCHKRFSAGRIHCWPSAENSKVTELAAHQFQVLVFGGDAMAARGAPVWRRVSPVN